MLKSLKNEGLKTIDDVLEHQHLNWDAEQHELITNGGVDVPTHKALVRSDNRSVLGVVGSGYTPVQNSEAFAFMDALVQEHSASYEYVHSFNGGSRMVVQAHIDNNFEVRKGDRIASYITMVNSFDGTTPFKVYFTPIRMFCTNQLGASWRNKQQSISVRHTVNARERADDAFKVLSSAQKYFDRFQELSRVLAQKSLDKKLVEEFIRQTMGEKDSTRHQNQVTEIMRLTEEGKGNGGGTVWDLYNGVTEYVDHFRIKNDEKRLASAMVGSGATLKDKAWTAALRVAEVN